MQSLFDHDIVAVQVRCKNCGTPLELADSALDAFGSLDNVLCLDCLLNEPVTPANGTTHVGEEDRLQAINSVINQFSDHLRTVLMRNVSADLSWNSDYHFDMWSNQGDALAAAHAPGIWYALRDSAAGNSRADDN